MFSSKLKKNFIISAVLYILFGVLLCIWPQQIRYFIFILLGTSLLFYGIAHIFRFFNDKGTNSFFQYQLAIGLTSSILGLFFFFRPDFPDTFIPFSLGIAILINGFIKLQYAITMKKHSASNWKWLLSFSIIQTILGFSLILFTTSLNNFLTILIGVAFILAGISDIISYIKVKSFFKKLNEVIK